MSILYFSAISAFFLSLVAKILADTFLTERVSVLGSFAGLQYATNAGVAFSITFPGQLQNIFIAAALIALIFAARYAKTTWSRIAFGLIIGGALGNIVDRLRDGLVTDFFQVGTFPIFNVADSCITIGVGLLLLEAVMQWSQKRTKHQVPISR